jgi:cytochrome b6
VFSVGGLIWALVPFLDKKSKVDQPSGLFLGFGILVVAFIIIMTMLGYALE